MTALPNITVETINLKRRLARSTIGYGAIECFLDADGDETQDASIATIAVIEWFAGGWSTVELADYPDDPLVIN